MSDKKIKIAFIIDTIKSPSAGTEKQLLLLLNHLDHNKFEPYLCVLYSSEWLETEFSACPLYVVGITSFKKVLTLRSFMRFSLYLRRERFDIVQTFFRDANIVGVLAGRFAGIRAVIGSRRNQGYWLNWRERIILKLLDRSTLIYVANSRSTKHWASKAEGLAMEKIVVIYNALDFSLFREIALDSRIQVRKQLGIDEKTLLVVLVANLRPVKDIDTFIKAAARVHQSQPDIKFLIVGEGSEKIRIERLAVGLGLNGAVKFLGMRLDIPDILRASDVGVLTSKSESFSNAIAEYLAAGLPVVSTQVGGSDEAINPDVNGYLVEVGDYEAIASCILQLRDNSRRAAFNSASRAKAQSLFPDITKLTQYQQLYESISGLRH